MKEPTVMLSRCFVWAGCLAGAACAGTGAASEDQDNRAGDPLAATLGTVTGHQVSHFYTLDGVPTDTLPYDLHDVLVHAMVRTADGGWRVAPGNATRAGTFAVPAVPTAEPYWLRVAHRPAGDEYVWTDAREVSFDDEVLGHLETERDVEGPVGLVIDAPGMAPWAAGDQISLYIPDHDIFAGDLAGSAQAGAPSVGDVALNAMRNDWIGRTLAETKAGDAAFVIQYQAQTTAGGVEFTAPVKSFTPPPFHQVAGVDTTLTGAFTTPPIVPYRVAWDLASFEAERAVVHPTRASESYGHWFYGAAVPAGNAEGDWSLEYPWLSIWDSSIFEGSAVVDLGELAVPTPFPEAWLVATYSVSFAVDIALPDGRLPRSLEASIAQRTRIRPSASAPMRPVITPARAPRIGNANLYNDLTGVGATPTIEWTQPAVGTPTSYTVSLVQAMLAPPSPWRPGWFEVATFHVPGDVTSLAVPPDVLRAGESYVLKIRAVDQRGQDLRTAPYRRNAEIAYAELITGVFSP